MLNFVSVMYKLLPIIGLLNSLQTKRISARKSGSKNYLNFSNNFNMTKLYPIT